jgi:hypothetical protein
MAKSIAKQYQWVALDDHTQRDGEVVVEIDIVVDVQAL